MRIPDRDPERPQDDPWDADAVRYLLGQSDVGTWTHGNLRECLRRQGNRMKRQPELVGEAARFARRHGVEQRDGARGRGILVRLYRTDPDAPEYLADERERRRLLRDHRD